MHDKDEIEIKDLRLRAIIGIEDWERKDKQDIVVNIVLNADLLPAGRSDRIEDAVNYRTLTKKVIAMVESSAFRLVEALADAIARICLDDRRVEAVEVSVEKPGALRFADSVGVRIVREQADYENEVSNHG